MIGLRLHRVNEKPVTVCFCARFPVNIRLCLPQDDRYDVDPLSFLLSFALLTSHTYALKCVLPGYIAHCGDSLKAAALRSGVTV